MSKERTNSTEHIYLIAGLSSLADGVSVVGDQYPIDENLFIDMLKVSFQYETDPFTEEFKAETIKKILDILYKKDNAVVVGNIQFKVISKSRL